MEPPARHRSASDFERIDRRKDEVGLAGVAGGWWSAITGWLSLTRSRMSACISANIFEHWTRFARWARVAHRLVVERGDRQHAFVEDDSHYLVGRPSSRLPTPGAPRVSAARAFGQIEYAVQRDAAEDGCPSARRHVLSPNTRRTRSTPRPRSEAITGSSPPGAAMLSGVLLSEHIAEQRNAFLIWQ